MAIKKISDYSSGNLLQPVDKVLVARGATNVYVTGAAVPATQDFNPPYASMFPNGSWGEGSTTGLFGIDHERGLQMIDPTADNQGAKLMTRPIPQSMRGNFWFVAHVNYGGLGRIRSGAGIAVSTGATGSAAKHASVYRYIGDFNVSHTAYVSSWDGSALTDLTGIYTEIRWFRGEISGTVVTFYGSQDGINWSLMGSKDVGEEITEYGLYMLHYDGVAADAALCDYFDSAELNADPLIRQAAVNAPKLTGINAPHQYWRINVSRNWGGNNLALGLISMRSTPGGVNRCFGGSPIASGYVSFGPWQSFGGQYNSSFPGWLCNRTLGFIGYRFAFPVVISEIAYMQAINAGGYPSTPRDFTLEYSDDGITWEVANTYTDAPIADTGSYNVYPVDPTKVVRTAPNPAAASLGLQREGCRAAYSTRRLFDKYNGPLFSVTTTTGNDFDVFAGADGKADTAGLMQAVGTRGAYISTWYDQSGNGYHANPMPDASLITAGNAYRPTVALNGVLSKVNDTLALRFDGSPLDIDNLNILTGSYVIVRGSFVQPDNFTNPHIVSAMTTNVDAFSLGYTSSNMTVSAMRTSGDVRVAATPALTAGAPTTIVAKFSFAASTARMQAAINGTTLGTEVSLSYGSSQSAAFARIGAPSWQNTPNYQYNWNNVNGSSITEILIYDSAVDLNSIFTGSGGSNV